GPPRGKPRGARGPPMKEWQGQAQGNWDCKYRVVILPKSPLARRGTRGCGRRSARTCGALAGGRVSAWGGGGGAAAPGPEGGETHMGGGGGRGGRGTRTGGG